MIEGDIKAYFDNINHHKLAELLSKTIKDKNIIDLYWKLVKAGYIETNSKLIPNHIGVPQGGVLSPILSNIYLHELDVFMEHIKNTYKTGKQSPEYNKAITPYRKAVLKYKADKSKENLTVLKEKRKILMNTNYTLRTGVNVHYVRYADDFIVGVLGPKTVAEEIKAKIAEFLKKELLIELNEDKTKVTHVQKDCVKFLGYKILVTDKEFYESKKTVINGILRRCNHGRVKLYIPTEDLVKRLRNKGFVRQDVYKGKYYGPWVNHTEQEIIIKYRAIIMGYMNYYILADDYYNIKDITYLLKYSAAHTLAAKYKSSLAKIIQQYGKNLAVEMKGKVLDLNYQPDISKKPMITAGDPLEVTKYNLRTNFSMDKPCQICGKYRNASCKTP